MNKASDEKLSLDLYQIDALYKSPPPFKEWVRTQIDDSRWERYKQLLEERKSASPELIKDAQELVRIAAAVDTGAIEGLYETDKGFTFSVASAATLWPTIVRQEKGEKVRGLIEAQLDAYEYVLDLSTEQNTTTESAIRELHEVICRNQDTYAVHTSVGVQQRPLIKGEYKTNRNHVYKGEGKYHAYAPPDFTPAEMERFVGELRSAEFQNAHPALQASYAHYAFVAIHPFSDGNGRVARALASVFTTRHVSVPVLILDSHKNDYLDALSAADNGEFRPFVQFILERTLDSIQMVDDSIKAAQAKPVKNSLESLSKLTRTLGGYTHAEVGKAGLDLLSILLNEVKNQLDAEPAQYTDLLESTVSYSGGSSTTSNGYRSPGHNNAIMVYLKTKQLPENVQVHKSFFVIIPIDSGTDDDVLIKESVSGTPTVFSARASELIPNISDAVAIRLSIFVRGVLREMFAQLEDAARKRLGR